VFDAQLSADFEYAAFFTGDYQIHLLKLPTLQQIHYTLDCQIPDRDNTLDTAKCLPSPEFEFHVPVLPTPARQLDSAKIGKAERANTDWSNRTIRDTNRISQVSFKGTAKCREKVKNVAVNGDPIVLCGNK
jgi:hypothetical protein